MAEVEKEKKILNMVSVQGKVSLSTLALELKATLDQVKNWIYDLVGKGLFTGYIDWKSGTLFAKDAGACRAPSAPTAAAFASWWEREWSSAPTLGRALPAELAPT